MKKGFWILSFVLLISIQSIGQSFSGDSWEEASRSKKGKIVITYTETPKFAENVNGQHKGLCFDIMKEFISFVQKKHGVQLTVEYKAPDNPKDFDEFLTNVKNSSGGVFGLADVTITEGRKEFYNFSPSYFSNVAILATHQSVPTLKNMATISTEFGALKAVVQNGTTHEERLKNIKNTSFPSLQIETTTGYEEANKLVALNKTYFTYIDFSTYLNVIEKKVAIKRHPAGDQPGEDFGFIMPKDSDWEPVLAEFFSQNGGYTNTVEYRKLVAQHMGNHVVKMLSAMK